MRIGITCFLMLALSTTVWAKENTLKHETAPQRAPRVQDSDEATSGDASLELLPIEENIVKFTNEQRKRYGLPPLEVDTQLVRSARQHAIWMTRNRSLQHTRKPVAENIAMGYQNSQGVVRGWMNSSGHRANILSRGHRKIGVAAYRTSSGTIYWCQQFRR